MDEHLSDLVALAELRAADVMEVDLVVVAEHESLAAAVGLLLRSGCQFLPVVRNHRLVGVVDDGAVQAYQAGGADAAARVEAYVRPSPAVRFDAPLPDVVAAVRSEPAMATAVVDGDGRLVGLITTARLVALLDAATHRTGERGPNPR